MKSRGLYHCCRCLHYSGSAAFSVCLSVSSIRSFPAFLRLLLLVFLLFLVCVGVGVAVALFLGVALFVLVLLWCSLFVLLLFARGRGAELQRSRLQGLILEDPRSGKHRLHGSLTQGDVEVLAVVCILAQGNDADPMSPNIR